MAPISINTRSTSKDGSDNRHGQIPRLMLLPLRLAAGPLKVRMRGSKPIWPEARVSPLDLREPFVDCALGLLFVVAIALLEDAEQFDALAVHDIDIVVGELAPLLLSLALELLPVAFNLIPIHLMSLSVAV